MSRVPDRVVAPLSESDLQRSTQPKPVQPLRVVEARVRNCQLAASIHTAPCTPEMRQQRDSTLGPRICSLAGTAPGCSPSSNRVQTTALVRCCDLRGQVVPWAGRRAPSALCRQSAVCFAAHSAHPSLASPPLCPSPDVSSTPTTRTQLPTSCPPPARLSVHPR